MLRFLLYAVVAYFIYQFVMAVDWGSATSEATRKVENTADNAYQDVKHSSVVETIGDAFGALKDLLF